MSNIVIDLKDQAKQFVQDHFREVENTKRRILKAATLLLSCDCFIGLDNVVRQQAHHAYQAEDLSVLFNCLRQSENTFVQAKLSKPYWAWIDAAKAYFDAPGTQWHYLTLEQRAWSLADANEALSDVQV